MIPERGAQKKPLRFNKAVWLMLFIGSLLFVAPTMVAVKGVSALYSFDRLTLSEFFKSLLYGSIADVSALFVDKDPSIKKTLHLEVGTLNLRHFNSLLEEARSQKILTKKTKEWIPAKIHIDGERYRVKFRLRGDLERHWVEKKISLRLKILGDELWNGRKDINLIAPQHAGYFIDVLLARVAEMFSLPNNNGEIVSLQINGSDAGSYVLLERYDKVLLERQNEVFSSIFKIDETLFMSFEKTQNLKISEYNFSQDIAYSASMWDSRTKNAGNVEEHRGILANVFNIIHQNDTLSDHNYEKLRYVLNLESYSWQSVFNFMFGAHLDAPHNGLIYFDSVTGQFRPLLVDPNFERLSYDKIDNGHTQNYQFILNKLTTNEKFIEMRNRHLRRLYDKKEEIFEIFDRVFEESKPHYIGDGVLPSKSVEFGAKFSTSMNGPLLYFVYYGLRNSLEARFNLIGQYLENKNGVPTYRAQKKRSYEHPLITTLINYKNNQVAISIRHNGATPLSLTSISFLQDRQGGGPPSIPNPRLVVDGSGLQQHLTLIESDDNEQKWSLSNLHIPFNQVHKINLLVEKNPSITLSDFNFIFEDKAGKKVSSSRIVQRVADSRKLFQMPATGKDFFDVIKENSNISFQLSKKDLFVLPGDYIVHKTIIVPKGYRLIFMAGTNIDFHPDTWFVSYSPVSVLGTINNPVAFKPHSPHEDWNGFLVFQTNQEEFARSNIKHLILKGGKSGTYNGISVTGALLFADSDVDITNSIFINSGLDDSINIKRSHANIEKNVFLNATSDAIDIDVGTGTVSQNLIYESGGDGIDVSGSENLTVDRNLVIFSSDKAVSVGENSKVVVNENVLAINKYGAVSKDLSRLAMERNVILYNQVGLAAYQKKSFFGGARIIGNDNLLINNAEKFQEDKNSSIQNINKEKAFGSPRNFHEPSAIYSPIETLNWLKKQSLPSQIELPIDLWKKQIERN